MEEDEAPSTEEIVVDVPLDRVREVAREEALRTLPSPADLRRDTQNQARQAAREESARAVREALANLDLDTRVARIEGRATDRATRAAAEHVTPHLDALPARPRSLGAR